MNSLPSRRSTTTPETQTCSDGKVPAHSMLGLIEGRIARCPQCAARVAREAVGAEVLYERRRAEFIAKAKAVGTDPVELLRRALR